MIKFTYSILTVVILFFSSTTNAQQDGALDTTFNPEGSFENSGTINVIAKQPDGKTVVGGTFDSYAGFALKNIARINADGTVDTEFNTGSGLNFNPSAIIIQPDGKILVGGGFSVYNGVTANKIIRLNSDGTIDSTFQTGLGLNRTTLSDLKILPDGKIMASGNFTSYNGTTVNKLIRINPNGSLDTTFTNGSNLYSIFSIAIQQDGKILIGGQNVGINVKSIFRLNTDGSNDSSFVAPQLNIVRKIVVQSDERILVSSAQGFSRLNNDGSLDNSFFTYSPGATVYDIEIEPNGKILVCGLFDFFNGTSKNNIARLNIDGTLDSEFSTGSGFDNIAYALAILPDGKIMVGGNFSKYDQSPVDSMIRLNSTGNADSSFATSTVISKISQLIDVAIQNDGKILVAGAFNYYNGNRCLNILRFNTDGSLDNSFNTNLSLNTVVGGNTSVRSIKIQSDGKILAAGYFTKYNGLSVENIVRLNVDGSVDQTFSSTAVVFRINEIAIQPDGKILIGGSSGNSSVPDLVRLHPDGSIDSSFVFELPNDIIYTFALLPDGNILLAAYLDSSMRISRIVRLMPNGAIDNTFNTEEDFKIVVVDSIVLQADGKILIGGMFSPESNFNGILRLNADGTKDSSFLNGTGIDPNGDVLSILVQDNGKIILGGSFESYNGTPSKSIVRLNANGVLDTTFNLGSGFDNYILSLAQQSDGKILAVGGFEKYNGLNANKIVRLNSEQLSTENFSLAKPTIYPNPANEKLFLVLNEALTGYEIFDFSGKKIRVGNTKTVDVSSLPKGIYLIKVNTEKTTSSHKFIKE